MSPAELSSICQKILGCDHTIKELLKWKFQKAITVYINGKGYFHYFARSRASDETLAFIKSKDFRFKCKRVKSDAATH